MNLKSSVKLAVFIPEKLARGVKAIAALQGKSVSQITEELFADFVSKNGIDDIELSHANKSNTAVRARK
jgi:hypothetical protein